MDLTTAARHMAEVLATAWYAKKHWQVNNDGTPAAKRCEEVGLPQQLRACLDAYVGEFLPRMQFFSAIAHALPKHALGELEVYEVTKDFLGCNQKLDGGMYLWVGPKSNTAAVPIAWGSGVVFSLDHRGLKRHATRLHVAERHELTAVRTTLQNTYVSAAIDGLNYTLLWAHGRLHQAARSEGSTQFPKNYMEALERIPSGGQLGLHKDVARFVASALTGGYSLKQAITAEAIKLQPPLGTHPVTALREFALTCGRTIVGQLLERATIADPHQADIEKQLLRILKDNRYDDVFDPYINLVVVVAILQLRRLTLRGLLQEPA